MQKVQEEMNREEFKEEINKQIFILEQGLEGRLGIRLLMTYQCLKCKTIIDDPFDMLEHTKRCKGKQKCPRCSRDLEYSEQLAKAAKKGERDAGNNIILDGWYCPVCDY